MSYPHCLGLQALAACLVRLSRRESHDAVPSNIINHLHKIDPATIPFDDRQCPICLCPYGENRGDVTSEEPVQLPCSHIVGQHCLAKFHDYESTLETTAALIDEVEWTPHPSFPRAHSFLPDWEWNLSKNSDKNQDIDNTGLIPEDLVTQFSHPAGTFQYSQTNTTRCIICRQKLYDAVFEVYKNRGAFRGTHIAEYKGAERISDEELHQRLLSMGAHFNPSIGWIWCGHRIVGLPLPAQDQKDLTRSLEGCDDYHWTIWTSCRESHCAFEYRALDFLLDWAERKLEAKASSSAAASLRVNDKELEGIIKWEGSPSKALIISKRSSLEAVEMDRHMQWVQEFLAPRQEMSDRHKQWLQRFLATRQEMSEAIGLENATVAATLFEFRKHSGLKALSAYASRSQTTGPPTSLVSKALAVSTNSVRVFILKHTTVIQKGAQGFLFLALSLFYGWLTMDICFDWSKVIWLDESTDLWLASMDLPVLPYTASIEDRFKYSLIAGSSYPATTMECFSYFLVAGSLFDCFKIGCCLLPVLVVELLALSASEPLLNIVLALGASLSQILHPLQRC